MSSEETFDLSSMFYAVFMKPPINKKDAASVQRTTKSTDAGLEMLEAHVARCRLGDQPSATQKRNDRSYLCEVMKIMTQLDEVCIKIAKWEGWNAEEYKMLFKHYPERFKELTNRGLVCYGRSKKHSQQDLGNWWYVYLYYCIHLSRPEFVEQLGEVKESLQVNRFPAVTSCELETKGDVIEYALHLLRFTGPKIDKEVRDRRNEMMQLFCKFSVLMENLEMRLARSPILTRTADKWCNSQRPQPEAFALAVHLCKIAYEDPNDVNLCEAYRAVQALCTKPIVPVHHARESYSTSSPIV